MNEPQQYQSVATAPAKQDDKQLPTTLGGWIERMKPELARALPSHLSADRLARIATTALRTTPRLSQTTPQSFLGSLLTAAQLGLEPNTPLGECWILPYRIKNKETNRYDMVAQYIQGYQGLVTLGYRSGQVAGITAEVVHEADEFEFGIGDQPFITHTPSLVEDRGMVIAAYAVVELKDGSKVRKVMSRYEIERIRRRSQAANNGPWVTDWEAMARKTVFKQVAKWMPKTPELQQLHLALTQDEAVRTDVGELVTSEPTYIEGEVEPPAEPVADDQQPEQSSATDEEESSESRGAQQSSTPPDGGDTGGAKAEQANQQPRRKGTQK